MDLVCYLSNGFPNHEETIENARAYIAGGCNVIEVDLPTDNPFMDGELLQERMIHSYNQDPTLESHIETIYKLRREFPDQRLITLAYEKTVKKMGLQRFVTLYNENSIEAVILVATEDDEVKEYLMSQGLQVVSYIPYHFTKEEIANARNTNGFIYLQAKAEQREASQTLEEVISYIRYQLKIADSIYCGVGITSPADIRRVKNAKAEGVFVGSAVFTKEKNKQEMSEFISTLKQET
ncbi:tryptophan synthase subunit alpha [Amphibacillus sp. Q70]|uniref:tryptophan synthase subunit alpha n=1 Tax=Amphibacillus sp. Q70 TaxID=3453416 RepID=UPI003F87B84F